MEFGTVINCIDGRVQIPVLEYLEKHFRPDVFDACNEAGPLKLLTERNDSCRMNSLKAKIAISTEIHGSRMIAIVGHHDCAGNPRSRPEQEAQILRALDYLCRAYGRDMLYLGLYVDEHWQVHEITRIDLREEKE